MDIYAFSSGNLTNIWAAIGARKWAVSLAQSQNSSIRTKSQNLPIGSFGLFYCVETKSLTTPFVIRSKPSKEDIIKNIWPEHWALPFNIIPFGTPNKQLHKDELANILPFLQGKLYTWDKFIHISPTTIFAASKIPEEIGGFLLIHWFKSIKYITLMPLAPRM
jgi:hypothetical protein